MCLGFKIEIAASIYKLPGKILTYATLVEQIVSNFKERIPSKFKISFSTNDDSEYINIGSEQDFKQLLAYAAEKNLKNIKLKVSKQNDQENILKDLDESTFNWCDLIDRFDIEDPQQKQQSQSASCLDKNKGNTFFNNVDQYVFDSDNELDDKLDQLDFSKEGSDGDDSASDNNESKNEESVDNEQPENQKTEKIISLDESAIIFIRSENYSPFYFEQEQSTEIIQENQQKAINGNDDSNQSQQCQKSRNSSEDETKKSDQSFGCNQQNDLIKENNQIKFFNQSNQNKLEQINNPSLTSSACLNNQMTNKDYPQQQNVYPSQRQNYQNYPTVPPIPLIQNNLPSQPFSFKCQTSSHIMFPLSTYHNINPQNTTTAKQNMPMPPQFPQQSFAQFAQNRMSTQTFILDNQQIPFQNRQQDFCRRFGKQEEISKSINHNEKNIYELINGKRKSKTTISPVPYNSNLTTSIYCDNANQSTIDHSNNSLLNGSQQTNPGSNSFLSRKLLRCGTLIDDDSYYNQSGLNFNDNRMFATQSTTRIPISQNPQQQMYSSLKTPQQQNMSHSSNDYFLQQGFQNLVKACANSNPQLMASSANISSNASTAPILNISGNEKTIQNQMIGNQNSIPNNILNQNGQTILPENFVRDKERHQSYKIQCQQQSQYRAKILIQPKKNICVTPGYSFSLLFSFQNNGETQWPQNVILRCIEGFSEGACFSIESAQATSTVTAEVNLVAPSKIGAIKNSFRLCYKQEDEQLKYFGPKLTFELNIALSMESDNIKENDIMRFNQQTTTPKINKSDKTTVQFFNFESSMQNYIQQTDSTQIKNQSRVYNTMNLPSLNLCQNDHQNNEASPTFISPIKNENSNITETQQPANNSQNKFSYMKIQTTPDIQFNQNPRISIEQLIAQKKSNYQQDMFNRRSININ